VNGYFSGEQRPTSEYPQVIEMTLASGFAPARLDIVGGSPELADDARVRLFDLQRLWLDDDADRGLAGLRWPSQGPIPVAPETLLLLGLAETLGAERGLLEDRVSRFGRGPVDLNLIERSFDRQPKPALMPAPPRLDFSAMTVSLDAPLPDTVLESLRSWSSGLTVDLVMADLIEGGAWGASVSVGGVARTFGIAGDGGNWTVTVLAPDGCTRVLQLGDGAIASSTQPPAQRDLPHPRFPNAAQPDRIGWAAVLAEMAWQAQVIADGLIGRDEGPAVTRLAGTAERALLYRCDGQMREICPA
jgi:hypothetical protein